MVRQPSSGFQGQATDIEIHAREILTLRGRLNQIYVEHTGQDIGVIEEAMERDKFLSPDDAREFGLIDEAVTSCSAPDDDGEAPPHPGPLLPAGRRGGFSRRLLLLGFSPPACGRGRGRVGRLGTDRRDPVGHSPDRRSRKVRASCRSRSHVAARRRSFKSNLRVNEAADVGLKWVSRRTVGWRGSAMATPPAPLSSCPDLVHCCPV